MKNTVSNSTTDGPELLLTGAVRLLPKERRDWGRAMLAELAQFQNPTARWWFALGCTRVALFPPRKAGLLQTLRNHTMKSITTNPRAAALIGFMLALPFSLLFPIAVFQIEPFHGFLNTLFTEADGVRQNTLSKMVLIVTISLLPVASVIALAPVLRSVRAGNGLGAHSMNLSLAVAILFFIAMIVGGFAVDQYPCWIGVPNCD